MIWRGKQVTSRQMNASALGKHIGHAVEGHCRAMFRRLFERTGYQVLRKLPFGFPVNPDIVVVAPDGKIRSLGIVGYARDAKGTDKKYYRTRLEYFEILRAWQLFPERFTDDFIPLVVLYGASGGWKDELIKDLQTYCPPTLYLPSVLGAPAANALVDAAFGEYRLHWEEGGTDSREYVEDQFARLPTLDNTHHRFLETLSDTFANNAVQSSARGALGALSKHATGARVPEIFSTRIRQGLSLASVFPEQEIVAWRAYRRHPHDPIDSSLESFIRRGRFLDLVEIVPRRSIKESFFTAEPRRPLQDIAGRQEYAPHRPDFESWETISLDLTQRILSIHRHLPCKHPRVFHAGALDQAIGNYYSFCTSWSMTISQLLSYIQQGSIPGLIRLFQADKVVAAEGWQPSSGTAGFLALWSLCTAAAAIIDGERKVLAEHRFRREQVPSMQDMSRLAQVLVSAERKTLASLFLELGAFCRDLLEQPLESLAQSVQPRLLSLDEPCSWVSACYLAIVTNPSHNPLCIPTSEWLHVRYPEVEWIGWPIKRTAAIRALLPTHVGRVQWQFLGHALGSQGIIAAEVKSVTANHWGDKSKEIYDRIAETRHACSTSNVPSFTIGVLDGDLDASAVTELETGRGYDETFSITEILQTLTHQRN